MQTRTPNSTKKAKSWKLGTFRKGKSKDGKETRRLVLDKNVRILVGEQEADLGEYNMIYLDTKEKMLADLDFKVSKGWLTEDQAAKEAEMIEEKGIVGSFTIKLKD